MDTKKLADAVVDRIFVELEASGRHVHVTKAQSQMLFGHSLTPKRPLSQPGQFLSNERLTVKGPKGEFKNVAVLGPERKEAQVELSLTDSKTLGVQLPVRPSGHVAGSPGVTLIGPLGEVHLQQGAIAAQRHIHMTPEKAAFLGVEDGQTVKLQTFTERPIIFCNVLVRVSPDYETFAHLDYDEANACGFHDGDLGLVIL